MNENKKKQNASSTTVTIFLALIIGLGASVYFLQNYYFIDEGVVFDPADSKTSVTVAKVKQLKPFDFSLFEGGDYQSLVRGFWQEIELEEIKKGNAKPFEVIVFGTETN